MTCQGHTIIEMSNHRVVDKQTLKRATVEAAYMGRLGTGYSCLLYPVCLISVVQLTGPGRPGDRNMRAN